MEKGDVIGYGIDGVSIQEKIKRISKPDYKFHVIKNTKKICR